MPDFLEERLLSMMEGDVIELRVFVPCRCDDLNVNAAWIVKRERLPFHDRDVIDEHDDVMPPLRFGDGELVLFWQVLDNRDWLVRIVFDNDDLFAQIKVDSFIEDLVLGMGVHLPRVRVNLVYGQPCVNLIIFKNHVSSGLIESSKFKKVSEKKRGSGSAAPHTPTVADSQPTAMAKQWSRDAMCSPIGRCL